MMWIYTYTHTVKGKREGNSRLWWYGLLSLCGGVERIRGPQLHIWKRVWRGVPIIQSTIADDGNRMRMKKKGPTNKINSSSSASSVAGWISSEFDTSSSPVLLRLRFYWLRKRILFVLPCVHTSAPVCVCLILGNFLFFFPFWLGLNVKLTKRTRRRRRRRKKDNFYNQTKWWENAVGGQSCLRRRLPFFRPLHPLDTRWLFRILLLLRRRRRLLINGNPHGGRSTTPPNSILYYTILLQ